MKEIFDWLREQRINTIELRDGRMCVEVSEVRELINEAEAKWEAECCEWKNVSCDNWTPSCETNSTYNVFGVAWFRRCPYCGKRIKISEVE